MSWEPVIPHQGPYAGEIIRNGHLDQRKAEFILKPRLTHPHFPLELNIIIMDLSMHYQQFSARRVSED